MASPINQKNSIESSCFVLVFERAFHKQELLSLSRLEHVFNDELPSFKEINSIKVKLVDGTTAEQSLEISGAILQCFKNNGKPSWELKVENNVIEVSCFAYDNWTEVWEKAKRYLLETIKTIENDNNRLLICVLKIVDKFLSDFDNYRVIDIFSSHTPYLTQNILDGENGELWHVFQGWFEQLDGNTYLNNLNLITSNEHGRITTTIDHAIQCQFIKNPQLISDFKESELDVVFSKLHKTNKEILIKLLNNTQLENICL
ncbi:MAG: hypothetical protein Q8N96_13430 [Methylovulum sp.]|nr:hypothetical protein [Methylovulum sp.]